MSGLLLLVMIERVAVSSKTSSLASGGSPIHSCRALSQGLGGVLRYRITGMRERDHFPFATLHLSFVVGPDSSQARRRMICVKRRMENGHWTLTLLTLA